jgi:hypothetical protein
MGFIVWRGILAAWADLGTNGLGWFVGLGTPVLAVFWRASQGPSGKRGEFVRQKWKEELKHAFVLAIAVFFLIATWEACWNIPYGIWQQAQNAPAPTPRTWPVPLPPRGGVGELQRSALPSIDSTRLRTATSNLAKELVEFANQREGDFNALQQSAMAPSVEDQIFPGGGHRSDEFRAQLGNWQQGTTAKFISIYLPRLQHLMGDLENAGVDTSSVTRAIATGGAKAMGFRLSVLADRIGRRPPFEREIAPLEANEIAHGGVGRIQIYALTEDVNSMKVATVLLTAFRAQNRTVDKDIHPLEKRAPLPSGIHVVYTARDAASSDTTVPLLFDGEIASHMDFSDSPRAQNLSTRIVVWPCDSRCDELFVLQHRGLN